MTRSIIIVFLLFFVSENSFPVPKKERMQFLAFPQFLSSLVSSCAKHCLSEKDTPVSVSNIKKSGTLDELIQNLIGVLSSKTTGLNAANEASVIAKKLRKYIEENPDKNFLIQMFAAPLLKKKKFPEDLLQQNLGDLYCILNDTSEPEKKRCVLLAYLMKLKQPYPKISADVFKQIKKTVK